MVRNHMILWQWSDHGRGQSVANLCIYLENDIQGGSMAKRLHNFDLNGLQWSSSARPRGSGHSYEATSSAYDSRFGFKAAAINADKADEMAPSKLAERLRNLSIPRGNDNVPRGKGPEHCVLKGKQDKEVVPEVDDDVVKGAKLLTKQRELKKLLPEKDNDDVIVTEMIDNAYKEDGSCYAMSEGAKRWNLRDRKSIRLSKETAWSSSTRGLKKGKEKPLSDLSGNDNGGNKGKVGWPLFSDFSLSLDREEIIEDLTIMLGKIPPRKFKKRPRNVQRQIDFLQPGMDLGSITLDRYEVQEKPPTGKRK